MCGYPPVGSPAAGIGELKLIPDLKARPSSGQTVQQPIAKMAGISMHRFLREWSWTRGVL